MTDKNRRDKDKDSFKKDLADAQKKAVKKVPRQPNRDTREPLI